MGGNFSADPQKNNVTSGKYAKILVEDGPSLPSDIPSFKVLVHEQLAASASDSIEGSKIIAQEISKSLVVDLLRSKENPQKFGMILGDVLKFDSILQPTRALIYWSLNTETSLKNMEILSAMGLSQALVHPQTKTSTSILLSNFLVDKYFINQISAPYFQWLLMDRDYCIKPLAGLILWSLPPQKVSNHT